MINIRALSTGFIASIVLLVFFTLTQHSLIGQLFIEEGLERGMDAVISTQTLGGSGVSSIDFDQDGDDDLTLGNNGEVLFYQNIDDQFQLIDLGIETPSGEVRSVVWTDINNDGHLDLFITAQVGGVRLYKNNGELQFEDITESCGISTDIASNWGASFSDINRDGFVDVQLCRYASGATIPESPSIEPHLWTRLYLNNGDETFTDMTAESGLVIEPAPAFIGVFLDFNNDLWPDNYTIIDRAPGNRLFVNTNGIFSDVTEEHGVSYPGNDFMSNSVADFNNDGYLDVFMTNSGAVNRSTHLLQNNQGESFSNATSEAGVGVLEFCWGAVWIDANNNGWQDLFFSTQLAVPNHLFLNDQGTFTAASGEMQLENNLPSFSAAKGDYNNDGYCDLIVQSKAPDRSLLLMNQANENNYIKITPHGTISNSMATGSWIKVYANGSQYVHFTFCGEGYISQNSQHLIFGLGNETSVVDSVTVWYPSGHTDSYYNLPSDSAYHFYEGETFQVDIIPDDTLVCIGEQLQLDAGEHSNYLWSTGDTSQYISVETPGVYSVSVVNEFGISASTELDVVFQPLPIVSSTITPNACNGDSSATIHLENVLGIDVDSVIWNNGMTGETIDSLFSGDYSYTYTDVNGCSSSGTIAVTDPSELLVYANANPADVGESNGSIDVSVFGGVAPYIVVLEGDTAGMNIAELPSGIYTLSITDAYGCAVVVEVVVDSTLGSSGTKRPETISIYPNPTRGKVEVKSLSNIARVSIFGSTGILEKVVVPENNIIDLESLAAGPYFLKIELVNSEIGYFRIIKE